MLKKYYYIFRYMFIRTLQFRAEVIVYSFLDIVPFIVLFFLWRAVYINNEIINGYSFVNIIQYYLIAIFIERFSATHFEGWRSEEIRMGKIDYYLTRPFSYMSEILSKDIGSKIISLIFSLPILFIFYLFTLQFFKIPSLQFETTNILTFTGLMFFAYLVQFMIALWIVLLTFWFEGSSGLEHFKWIIITVFSGAMIPFAFMPSWLQTIFNYLPLKYINYIPIQVLQNNITLKLTDYLAIAITLVIMAIISLLLWSKAKYKYASAGG